MQRSFPAAGGSVANEIGAATSMVQDTVVSTSFHWNIVFEARAGDVSRWESAVARARARSVTNPRLVEIVEIAARRQKEKREDGAMHLIPSHERNECAVILFEKCGTYF